MSAAASANAEIGTALIVVAVITGAAWVNYNTASKADLAEVKADVRALARSVDALDVKLATQTATLAGRLDAVDTSIGDVKASIAELRSDLKAAQRPTQSSSSCSR